MRMVIGLSLGTALGWLAWLGLAVSQAAGWTSLSSHVRLGLGAALWNLWVQSMTLFMWVALTRQVREQTAGRPDLRPTVESLRRWRNRLFPWMALGLPLWMVPLVTGMLRAFGSGPQTLHSVSAWAVVGWTGTLTALELWGAARLTAALQTVDRHLRRPTIASDSHHDGPPTWPVD